MKKHWIRLVVCLAVAAVPATQAFALDWQKLLASEETFLAEVGDRAVFVAPGVYEVRERGGIKVRVAFGAGGREFDRAWVEADLLAGRALRDRSAQPSLQLEAHVRRLERLLENLQSAPESRAAVTGTVCGLSTFTYSLDGGLSSGQVFGKAKIGIWIDFSPPLPYYSDRYADNFLVANRSGMCWEANGSDSFTGGGFGEANSVASLSCSGTSCLGWRSFNEVNAANCSGGYRSLLRTGGNTACTWP